MIKGERRAMGIARLFGLRKNDAWCGLRKLNKHVAKRAKKCKKIGGFGREP